MLTEEQLSTIVNTSPCYGADVRCYRADFDKVIAQAREANTLRAQLAEVQQQLAEATGPHCTGCGSAIDPDWCWCGSASNEHGCGDGHNLVSMGCSCHQSSERDWIRHAGLLREQAWRDRAQLAEARQLVSLLGNQLAEAMKVIKSAEQYFADLANDGMDYDDVSSGPLEAELAGYHTWLASHPHVTYAGLVTVQPATVDGEVKR